jgi:hypothetical protein
LAVSCLLDAMLVNTCSSSSNSTEP